MPVRMLNPVGRQSTATARQETPLLYLIKKLQQKSAVRLEAALSPFGLTAVQFRILSEIGQRRNISSAELSRLFDVRPQSMSKQIAQLEAGHFITRKASDSNQRMLLLSLTPTGDRILDDCYRAARRLEDDLFVGMAEWECVGFRDTLQKLLRQLD